MQFESWKGEQGKDGISDAMHIVSKKETGEKQYSVVLKIFKRRERIFFELMVKAVCVGVDETRLQFIIHWLCIFLLDIGCELLHDANSFFHPAFQIIGHRFFSHALEACKLLGNFIRTLGSF